MTTAAVILLIAAAPTNWGIRTAPGVEPMPRSGLLSSAQRPNRSAGAVTCSAPRVIDGDSINCGSERLRLIGIDAPELHGCPRWRECVPGNGENARRSLARALAYGPLRYRIITRDRFGRAVVVATAGPVNLSCWQLSHGQARHKPQWDTGGEIARACR